MKNIKRITILENDSLHENCPLSDALQKYINVYKDIEFTIWDWFAQDTSQNKEQSIKRLKELSEDQEHVFLAYPSFIGWDNTFDGWLWYLNKLTELGIELKLYLIYGSGDETLIPYCLNFYQDQEGLSDGKENRLLLQNALEKHEIYFTDYVTSSTTYYKQKDMFSIYEKLNWETLSKLLIQKGDKIRIKNTGEIKEVIRSFYWKTIEDSHIDVIMDEKLHEFNKTVNGDRSNYRRDAYKEFKLSEVEKV